MSPEEQAEFTKRIIATELYQALKEKNKRPRSVLKRIDDRCDEPTSTWAREALKED